MQEQQNYNFEFNPSTKLVLHKLLNVVVSASAECQRIIITVNGKGMDMVSVQEKNGIIEVKHQGQNVDNFVVVNGGVYIGGENKGIVNVGISENLTLGGIFKFFMKFLLRRNDINLNEKIDKVVEPKYKVEVTIPEYMDVDIHNCIVADLSGKYGDVTLMAEKNNQINLGNIGSIKPAITNDAKVVIKEIRGGLSKIFLYKNAILEILKGCISILELTTRGNSKFQFDGTVKTLVLTAKDNSSVKIRKVKKILTSNNDNNAEVNIGE